MKRQTQKIILQINQNGTRKKKCSSNTEKEEQTKPNISRRKEIIKIRAEINEIETKKMTWSPTQWRLQFGGGGMK